MQKAPDDIAREPSESSTPATYNNEFIAEHTVGSAGPQIVLHRSDSYEGSRIPALQSSNGLGRSYSSEYSSSHESLNLDGPAIGDPSDAADIPRSIKCLFYITFDGAQAPAVANSLAINYTEPNSYQKVERFAQDIAQDHAKITSSGTLAALQFNFQYGNCTIIGDDVEKIGLPLTTREDWESVCAILVNYWRSDPLRKLHVDIYRDYFPYRSRATSEVSLAATKRREIYKLIKYTSENERYIPRTALMRFNSQQNIREIIVQDDRLDMESEEKEQFIQSVQSNAPCLLALCVYAGLKMKCLSVLIKHFSDAKLPVRRQDCCHDRCAPDFDTLLNNRGCFTPARFDKIGEHQDFHNSVVIPVYFIPVEEDQDENMKTGRERDLEKEPGGTSLATDDPKHSACCGSGAYSYVYRVRIDPEHHRLSKNKDVDFALKEFRERPDRGDTDFQRELKILDELRKYPLRHIVTHLATWTHRGKYYMLFPYAQCNLRQYMKWVQFRDRRKDDIIWLIRQFRGLAEALKGIHDLSAAAGAGALQPAPDLVTHPRGERRAGYHHDLKPANIIFYKATGNFEISDFGSGKVHTYRSGSYNTSSPHGTPTYEPPEAAGPGGRSRPYDMWSLGCVFLELLVWAVLGFPAVEEFREKRFDRRYPVSHDFDLKDDAFWQMLPNGDITLRKSVEDCIRTLGEAILLQRYQPFKEIFDLIIKMLDTVKESRIPALDLYDTLDRIYKQKKIDLENFDNDSLPDSHNAQERSPSLLRLSMNPPDRRSPERTREGAAIAVKNAGNLTGDFLTASTISPTSPRSPQGLHSRNSSTSEFMRSRNASDSYMGILFSFLILGLYCVLWVS